MSRARPERNERHDEPRAFVLGGNSNTLAFVHSFKPEGTSVTARLVPIAWTPIGVAIGDTWQNVGIALPSLVDWIDRTFAPEDERAFVAPMRDVELLARVQWEAELPESLSEAAILNIDDVPDEIVDGLSQAAVEIVQCAACRRLCVRNDFIWKEKQLCAWDFHKQVFGKRGPWRNGAYEEHHYETLPTCAYVAPPLLQEFDVEVVVITNGVDEAVVRQMIALVLQSDAAYPYMAVRTEGGYTILKESAQKPIRTETL